MYWFEAGSAPIFVHDFKVTLAGYVVCIMFISDLSVFSIIWYAGIWWFVWSWKYWRILYNQYMRFLEVLCVLCPSTVSFSREWGSRSIPAYFNRVWIAGKKGLFPVVDKSNFFQIFLTRSTSLLIWSETNTSGNVPLWSFLFNGLI